MDKHLRLIHTLAFSDGMALLLLVFVAVPVKYLLQMPLGVKVLGPLHGALFLSLSFSTLLALGRGLIQPRLAALIFFGALIPLGAFLADHQLKKQLRR